MAFPMVIIHIGDLRGRGLLPIKEAMARVKNNNMYIIIIIRATVHVVVVVGTVLVIESFVPTAPRFLLLPGTLLEKLCM